MQIERYGLTFTRLTIDDLELLRGWRNSETIRQRMVYKEIISPAAQLNWFNSLSNETNYYFIVTHRQRRIGLMNIKDIEPVEKCGEPGGFIVDETYLGTLVPALCLLILFDFAFNQLGLLKLRGKILDTNLPSVNANLALGGVQVSNKDGVCYMEHTLSNYMAASARYRQAANMLYSEPVAQFNSDKQP